MASPSPVPSVAVGINDSPWSRELTADGRVYFYNRATGASQWHIPNELYKSKCFDTQKRHSVEEDLAKMPGSARAVLGVDCVTEVLSKRRSSLADNLKDSVFAELARGPRAIGEDQPEPEPIVPPQPTFQIIISSARGLRDTDFMPGKDKSDPYCIFEIVGKPEAAFKTPTISDNLDPVWNHTKLVPAYSSGDVIVLTVRDYDESPQADHNAELMGGTRLFKSGDALLGRVMLSEDDLDFDAVGMQEFRLDESGKGIKAFISVQVKMLSAWPEFLGQPLSDVVFEIERACPDVNIVVLEIPDSGSTVVSWDVEHQKSGYTGNFFGVYAEAAAKLNEDDKIEINGEEFHVSHIDGPETPDPQDCHKMIVYLYVKEDIDGVLLTGMPWRKVTKKVDQRFHSDRVCVHFDPLTKLVVEVPRVG